MRAAPAPHPDEGQGWKPCVARLSWPGTAGGRSNARTSHGPLDDAGPPVGVRRALRSRPASLESADESARRFFQAIQNDDQRLYGSVASRIVLMATPDFGVPMALPAAREAFGKCRVLEISPERPEPRIKGPQVHDGQALLPARRPWGVLRDRVRFPARGCCSSPIRAASPRSSPAPNRRRGDDEGGRNAYLYAHDRSRGPPLPCSPRPMSTPSAPAPSWAKPWPGPMTGSCSSSAPRARPSCSTTGG